MIRAADPETATVAVACRLGRAGRQTPPAPPPPPETSPAPTPAVPSVEAKARPAVMGMDAAIYTIINTNDSLVRGTAVWCSGSIPVLGTGGPGFKPLHGPFCFFFFFYKKLTLQFPPPPGVSICLPVGLVHSKLVLFWRVFFVVVVTVCAALRSEEWKRNKRRERRACISLRI